MKSNSKTKFVTQGLRLCAIALAAVIALSMTSCPGEPPPDEPPPDTSTVTSVTVTPSSVTVAKGDNQQFTAAVAGTNSPPQTVTWSIVETGINAGTSIDSTGKLTVAGAETLAVLTVKAVSTVDVTKSGTAAVTISAEAIVNPISGKTTYTDDGKIVFSTTSGTDGTYTLYSEERDDNNSGSVPIQGGGQEQIEWEPASEGTYTWNQSAQTITTTPTKVAGPDGSMVIKAEVESLYKDYLEDSLEEEGIDLGDPDTKEALLEMLNEEMGSNYTDFEDAFNAYVSMMVDEMFAPRTYDYTFIGESLLLLETLPAVSGTDELAGKTFEHGYYDDNEEEYVKETDHTYVFSSGTARTYDEEGLYNTSTGSYSYNSAQKRVYFKPATIDGKTPQEYYEDLDYHEEYNNYPTEADYRTARTAQQFSVYEYQYDLTEMLIGWLED